MDLTTGILKVGPYKDSLLRTKIRMMRFQILSEMFDLRESLTQILTGARSTLTTSLPLACRKAALQAQ